MWFSVTLGMVSIAFDMGLALASTNAKHVATVTRRFGTVRVLQDPKDTLPSQSLGPQVKYEGKFYSEQACRVGTKIAPGSIIQTGKESRVRLVYSNGDQVTVAPLSMYQVRWDVNQQDSVPIVDLIMGKFRGLIHSGGPRKGMKVRTRHMAMGVRGTDFFVDANSLSGETKVTVIRGKVVVGKADAKDDEMSEVASGYSAEVATKPIVVKPVSKQILAKIHEETTVKKASEDVQALADAEKQELAALEDKATSSTLREIKTYDKKLYLQLRKQSKKKPLDVDAINQNAVKKLFEAAPSEKTGKSELKDIEGLNEKDLYDRYFKSDD